MRHVLRAIMLVVPVVGLNAQDVGNLPAFEVASVKPNKSGDKAIGGSTRGTEFRAINIPLRVLIRQAYGIRQDSELIGGPAWLVTDRFDIVAKMDRPGASAAMVRTLLGNRFKLLTHKETRELPIYALTVARSDGRLGPKLRPSSCGGRSPAGEITPQTCRYRLQPGVFVGHAPIPTLIEGAFSSEVQRAVVDRTGLTGNFDIDLHWSPENGLLGADPSAPSIFTALQEQLGLKLESAKGTVDVLVIDSVERPTLD